MSDCLLFLERMKCTSPSVFQSQLVLTKRKGQIVKVSNTLRFLDSFQFMSQSLDSLAKTLKKEDFALLKHYFTETSPNNDWTLLCEKGIFPYSYLDSFEKFNQPLPPYGNDWRNTLTGKIDVTKDQYKKALDLYNFSIDSTFI